MFTHLYSMARLLPLIVFLSFLTLAEVHAAAGGIPGAPPGVINKKTCSDAVVTTVTYANMNFGSFAVSAAGAITLTPTGVRIATAGMDTINTPVTVFTVSIDNPKLGCEVYDILLTLPATATLSGSAGGTMTLSNFVADPVSTPTTILGPISYPYTLTIGADITATFPQPAGTYTAPATAYTLTVSY